jgi:hypothetical protein
MNKANTTGAVGAVLVAVVWISSVLVEMLSPALAWGMLGACAGAFVLGLLAAVWGRKWWLLESGCAVLTAAFVLFGLVGS